MPVQAQHDLGPLSQDEEVSHDLGVLANRSLIVHTYTEHPQPQSCGLVLEHSTKSCTLRLQSQEWTIRWHYSFRNSEPSATMSRSQPSIWR